MSTVCVIIDFDNYFGSDITKLDAEQMEFALKEIVHLCERKFSNFSSIEIRLYGGWYNAMIFTKQASSLQQLLRNITVFPKVSSSSVINGSIQLATSLYLKPEFIWGHTYKETEGIKRIRLNHEKVDDLCKENRTLCPKYILYKFTDSKDKKCSVMDCLNLQKNIFKGAEQKMVDTLIACDIISISEIENIIGVLVVSDDQDHLPALALASIKKHHTVQSIILGIQNEKLLEFVQEFLIDFDIKTLLIT